MRRRNLVDVAARRQMQVRADVDPLRLALRLRVFRVPHLAVVGAGPQQALLDRRVGQRPHQRAEILAEVVLHDAAARDDQRRIARGQVRAELRPRMTLVRRAQHHLAAVQHAVGIERIDRQRWRPVATVLELVRRRIQTDDGRRHRMRRALREVEAIQLVAVARRPHDVRIAWLRDRESRFAGIREILVGRRLFVRSLEAAAIRRCLRFAVRPERPAFRRRRGFRIFCEQFLVDLGFAAEPSFVFVEVPIEAVTLRHECVLRQQSVAARLRNVTGNAPAAIILPVAVEPVRNLVVARDVIDLPVRQRDLHGSPCPGRDVRAAVIGQHVMRRIGRIDPAVVAISAGCGTQRLHLLAALARKGLATVARIMVAAVQDQHAVGVLRIGLDENVVTRAHDEVAVPAHDLPVAAAVVAAPDRTLVLGLDQCVHALRIGRRDGYVDLAERRFRKSVRGRQMRPCLAVVVRDVHAAARAAAQLGPRAHAELPGAGEHGVGIAWIHAEPATAGFLIDEQRLLPAPAAIGGAEHAAFALRRRAGTFGAHQHVVGVLRVDEDARDASRFRQAHVLPGRATVGGFVHPVADNVAGADRPRLAGAHPHRIVVGRRNRDGANRGRVLPVENRFEGMPAVGGLPQTTRGRTEVIRRVVAGNPRDGSDASAGRRTHVVELQRRWRRRLLRMRGIVELRENRRGHRDTDRRQKNQGNAAPTRSHVHRSTPHSRHHPERTSLLPARHSPQCQK